MNVYIVIQTGVYRHDVIGVFETKAQACLVAEGAARAEEDDYHDFEIVECVLGGTGERVVATVKREDETEKKGGRFGRGKILSTRIYVSESENDG